MSLETRHYAELLKKDSNCGCEMKEKRKNGCTTLACSFDHQIEKFVRDEDDFHDALTIDMTGNRGIGFGFGN